MAKKVAPATFRRETRTIHVGPGEDQGFCSNVVKTSKYTLLNFIPKNLWEQFRRIANVYFLVISMLQVSTNLSPTNKYATITPLTFVLLVTMAKEVVEDWARHEADERVNKAHTFAFRKRDDEDVVGSRGDNTFEYSNDRMGPTKCSGSVGSGSNNSSSDGGDGDQDDVSNTRRSECLFVPVEWKTVKVGDIVFIRNDESIPADILVLASHDKLGFCHIETANLDGETNLKLRQAIPVTDTLRMSPFEEEEKKSNNGDDQETDTNTQQHIMHGYDDDDDDDGGGGGGGGGKNSLDPTVMEWVCEFAAKAMGILECEESNQDLYSFEGRLTLESGDIFPVNIKNVLWRGTVLRNTEWVIGLVFFTGQQTKLIQNARETPSKVSGVDKAVNTGIILIFASLFIICLSATILHALWVYSFEGDLWYMPLNKNAEDVILTMITFLILYNNLVPISLYVSLELVKMAQAKLINSDIDMYHAETNTPALARTSNLNEDLGQVEYIFSDKTGTLTCNQMKFTNCAVGDTVYLFGDDEDHLTSEHVSRSSMSRSLNSTNHNSNIDSSDDVNNNSNSSSSSLRNEDHGCIHPLNRKLGAGVSGQSMKRSRGDFDGGIIPGHRISTVTLDSTHRIDTSVSLYSALESVHRASVGALVSLKNHQENNALYNFTTQPSSRNPHQNRGSPLFQNPDCDLDFDRNQGRDHKEQPLVKVPFSKKPTQPSPRVSGRSPRQKINGMTSQSLASPGIKHRRLGTTSTETVKETIRNRLLADFILCMATCHTVMTQVCKRGNVSYNYSSPDEGALVRAAKNLQYDFTERSFDSITLHIFGTPTTYQVLNVNEFTSDRKRMSVLLRMPDGSIVLFCKGADEIVLPLLKSNSSGAYSTAFIERHLTRFGNAGLRTLVMCKKVVEEEEYQDWNTRYQAAKTSLERRDEKLGELAAEIERDMLLLGASAIEDKLQDGVPETISMLTEAGIKIWMLTGDKLETARNIGVSCRLLRQKMDILELQEARDRTRVLHQIVESLEKNEKFVGRTNENFALVVTGQCLTVILNDPDLKTLFEALCKMAKTVVACRVIPSQKAAIVRLIHEGCDNPMTLAIGDGANDVAMIQEARLGVGISGNEGMQAVRNSDYSFAQFRYLQKLLLVHGHWNYRRVSVLILYSFYKNICNVLTLFFYGFHNGFTGTTLYESYLGSGWNVGWTLFPILLFGAFDQDLKSSTILSHPSIYIGGQRGNEFNAFLMCLWLFRALLHAFLVYFLCYGVFLDTISSSDGKEIGLFAMGTMTNFCTVLVVTYEVGLATKYWTKWNVLGVVGSLLFWFFFVYVYSQMSAISPDFYGIAAIIFAKPLFWLLILLVPTTAILSDYAWIYYRSQYSPTPIDILREQELLGLLSQEEEEAGHEAASVLYDVMQKELEAELQAITRRSLYGEEADNELEDSYASDGDAVGGNKYTDEGHLNVARLASQIRASQSKSTSDKTSSQTVNAKLLSPDRGEGHSNSDGNDASGHARNDQDDMNQSAKERKERHDAAGLHSDSAPLLSKKADKPSLKFSAYSVVSQLEPYVQQAYTIAHDGTLRISPPVRNILVRLGHLQNVLKFNQKAVDKSRSKESPLNTSLLSTVRQHWLTLTFEPVVSGRVHERQCEAKGGRVGKSRQSPMYGNDTSGDTKGRAGKFVRPRLISARSLRHLKIESNYTSSTTVRKIDQEDLHLSSVSSAFAEGLEEEYTLVSTIKNMEFRRTSMLIICLVVVVYGSYATIIAEENYILRLVLSVVLVGVVGTMWTHGVLRYFHQLMMVGIFVGGITKTILITQNGTLGMGMYCISSFFLLRTSYVHAFAMTMIDLFFYSFWMRYQGYLTWNQLLRFLFMYTLLLLFSTMVARKLEMYTRIDFLLQKEYQIKRTRTQEVVDNMMPRYITNQISKLMNRRKRKTAKSRFNTLTSNVKTAGNLDQHQLHHHHHRHRASDGTKRNSLRSKTDDPNMLVTLDDSSVISDQQDSSSRGMSIGQGKDQRDRAALSATALGRSVTMAAKVALNRNHSLSPRQGGSFRGVRIPGPLSASANGGSSSSKSADYRGSIGSRGSVDTGKGGGVVVKGGPGAGSEESAGGADKKTGDDAGANDRAGTGTSTSSKACTQGSAVGSDNAHSKDTEKKDSESGGAVNTSETNTDSTSVGGASAEVKRAEPGEAEQKDPKNDCDDLGQMPSPSSAAALKTLKFLSQRPSALIIPPLPARVFLTPCATPTKDALIHRASFSPTQPMPSPPSFRSREGRVSDETHSGRADHTPVVNTNTSLVSDHLNSAAFSVMNQPVGVCLRSSAKCQSAKDEGKDRIETARGIYAPGAPMHPSLYEYSHYILENDVIIANNEPCVSILFCDLAGMSNCYNHHTPAQLVAILDGIYSTFDELCVIFGVQKMETVGKTYMACAGLRGTRQDHAVAVAEMGTVMLGLLSNLEVSRTKVVRSKSNSKLKLFDNISRLSRTQTQTQIRGPDKFRASSINLQQPGLETAANDASAQQKITPPKEILQCRIGIHTGRVISGVVGTLRPQFSLFGDTVNTSSRMQSTGDVGKVHLSAATYELLKHRYHCTKRGPIKVKGKGSMNTYFLGRARTQKLHDAQGARKEPIDIENLHQRVRRAKALIDKRSQDAGLMGPDYKDSNIFSVPKDPKRLSRHCSSNASGKSSLPAASTLSVSTSRPPTGASLSHAPTRSTVNAVSHAAVYASSSGSIEEEVERKTIASSDGQSAQARKEGGSSVNTDSDNPSSTGSTESHVDGTGGNIGGGEGAKTNDDQGDTDLAFGSIDAVAGESESTEEGRGFCARWFCSLMTAGDMSSSSAQAQQLGHVRIIPYTLQFEKAMHEHTYMQFIRKSHGSLSRWAMLFGISFGALEPFFAYDSLEHKNATNVLVLLTMRYAFVLLCLLLLPVTFTQHFARHAAKYNAGIYGFAFISTALVPVLLSDPGLHYDSHITALTYVVYMTILCNSGTVRFGACSIMVVLAVVLYAVCALMSVMETGDVLYFSFLIICVAIINLTSSYGRELSARQEFVLTFRVRREKDKAERLLYAMLPKPVANALRSQDHIGGGEELKMNLHSRLSLQYNQVTILYSDIRGFTQYSAQNTPEDVVNLLSKLFSSFDRLTVVHQVYKVQTIGDAYVLVGGFPWAKNDGVTSLKLGLFDTDQGYDYEVDDEDEDYTVGVKVEEDDQGKVAVEGVPSVAGASGGKKEGRSLRVSTPSAAPGLNRLGSVSQKSNHSPNGARRRRSILKMERLKRMKRPRTSSQLALQSGGSQQASLAFLISGNDETGDENASAFRTISRSVTATDQPSQLSRTFSTGVFRATSISRMKPSVGESMVHVTSSLNSSAESEVAALNVTSMAFDMLAVIKYLSYPGIEMRIGIHTGNIIAGIIGTKQLRYDIWGTDCLIANSLESHGIPSGIVISRSTANYVKEYYALVPREDIVLKGRGGKSENGQSVRVTNFGIHYPYDFPEKILNIGKY